MNHRHLSCALSILALGFASNARAVDWDKQAAADAMKTWPYRRVLVPESCDGPKDRMNYPDGFVSKDRQWLHFAFDDNRQRAVGYAAK